MQLVLVNLFRTELIDGLIEEFLEVMDMIRVRINGRGCVISYEHRFNHALDCR